MSAKTHVIELKLRQMSQFFNSMDPSPFHEKDLDHDAEEFIVSWAQEYPFRDPLILRVHLEEWSERDPGATISTAVRNYFSYRAQIARRDFGHLMKQARTTLFIGLAFLAACLWGGNLISSGPQEWAGILKEGLTIAGWVALWRPIQIYLYDWWPLRRHILVCEKLSRMPVETVRA